MSFEYRQERIDYLKKMLVHIYSQRVLCQEGIQKNYDKLTFHEMRNAFLQVKDYYKEQAPIVNTFSQEMRDKLHKIKPRFVMLDDYISTTSQYTNGMTEEDIHWQLTYSIDSILNGLIDYENYLREVLKSEMSELEDWKSIPDSNITNRR